MRAKVLADAGALFSLIDIRQDSHARCRATLLRLRKPVCTTWPCFTEAMYLAYRAGGLPMQRMLWHYVSTRILLFYDLTEADAQRMADLMEAYRDTPMDLADASLVAAAESLNIQRVFTLDSDFYAYRRHLKDPFEVIP